MVLPSLLGGRVARRWVQIGDPECSNASGSSYFTAMTESRGAELLALARLFGKLGTTAFGGPAAHIALMEDEVVRRRGWLSREEFLDLLGATNLIPGPNSTELAIHIGRARAGWPGLLVAGAAFILPATLLVTACAWAYVRLGQLPAVTRVLYGVKPVVIAVVAQALWRLGRTALRTPALAALAAVAAVACALGVNELAVLFGGGLAAALAQVTRAKRAAGLGPLLVGGALTPASAGAVALWPLFAFFLKVGAVLFGSGYVLVAFLREGLVAQRGWLSESQLLDAVAVGQITPGPVFTTATFVGYLLAGGAGAAVATVGIFLPAFVFVALSAPLLPRLRQSPLTGAFLDGLNAASLALMAVVTVQLLPAAIVDAPTAMLALAGAVGLVAFGWSSTALVVAGALLGLLLPC
jgi:chromate transporter